MGAREPAQRYWRGNAPELVVVARSVDGRRFLVGEVKWSMKPAAASGAVARGDDGNLARAMDAEMCRVPARGSSRRAPLGGPGPGPHRRCARGHERAPVNPGSSPEPATLKVTRPAPGGHGFRDVGSLAARLDGRGRPARRWAKARHMANRAGRPAARATPSPGPPAPATASAPRRASPCGCCPRRTRAAATSPPPRSRSRPRRGNGEHAPGGRRARVTSSAHRACPV